MILSFILVISEMFSHSWKVIYAILMINTFSKYKIFQTISFAYCLFFLAYFYYLLVTVDHKRIHSKTKIVLKILTCVLCFLRDAPL